MERYPRNQQKRHPWSMPVDSALEQNFAVIDSERPRLLGDRTSLLPGPNAPRRKLTISVAGKIGEIVQGWTADLGPFFISAAVTSSPNHDYVQVDVRRPLELTCLDGRPFSKARQALNAFLARLNVPPANLRGHLKLMRSTPEGKGRGSSSIDTFLAIRGVAEANDLPAHPRMIYAAQCDVERSDPVYLDDVLVVTEPEAGVYHVVGSQPRLLIVGWDSDPRAVVDTEKSAPLDHDRSEHASEYHELLNMVCSGERTAIMQAATRSSILNNEWLPKPNFSRALEMAKGIGAGLISAHTGTYLGLMLPPDVAPPILARAMAGVRVLGCRPELFLMGGK